MSAQQPPRANFTYKTGRIRPSVNFHAGPAEGDQNGWSCAARVAAAEFEAEALGLPTLTRSRSAHHHPRITWIGRGPMEAAPMWSFAVCAIRCPVRSYRILRDSGLSMYGDAPTLPLPFPIPSCPHMCRLPPFDSRRNFAHDGSWRRRCSARPPSAAKELESKLKHLVKMA